MIYSFLKAVYKHLYLKVKYTYVKLVKFQGAPHSQAVVFPCLSKTPHGETRVCPSFHKNNILYFFTVNLLQGFPSITLVILYKSP